MRSSDAALRPAPVPPPAPPRHQTGGANLLTGAEETELDIPAFLRHPPRTGTGIE